MKRLLALILAATLLLACAIPAQATDSRKVEAAAVLYDPWPLPGHRHEYRRHARFQP